MADPRPFLCVDFGSTFTKAALVAPDGDLLGTASHPTTISTDVLDGFAACRKTLGNPEAEVLACSSAGGGLRIAVVGNEELVTAEAGRRVALSSGGRVVRVFAGPPEPAELHAAEPDLVLLVGGTDGGNSEVLLACAAAIAGWSGPIVVAGNAEARAAVADILDEAGSTFVLADNVVPRIGVLEPASARVAIREAFLRHVIGGKHLSAGPAFGQMVRGATPDVVLTAVELLAELVGDVAVVDVGGATTDVHSVVDLDPDSIGREVVATTRVTRTVEGDLGMRWSAISTIDEAHASGLLNDEDQTAARAAAAVRHEEPDYLPVDDASREWDRRIATAAITLALRRHAGKSQVVFSPEGRVVERTGKDLREVGLLVGSGGVLRHAGTDASDVVSTHLGSADGWQLPTEPRIVIDTDYVLAPAGLLAAGHPAAARTLLQRLL
ncbi:MAG: glutamate mutase L [Nocardioidaceae bacterium]|nr:MAG: glutamate mutase L [Nocardioidaceae bacterium]